MSVKTKLKLYITKLYRPRFVFPVLGIAAFLLFFQYSAFISWDAAHYLSYLPILDGTVPMSEWDVVRGPVFPVYLWLISKLPADTPANALLTVLFIVYAATLYLYYKIIIHVLPICSEQGARRERHKTHTMILVYVLIGLNPIFFSYYHIALTEHLAAFLTALIILASAKYYQYLCQPENPRSYNPENSRSMTKYYICIAILVISCPLLFFLRQNYLMLTVGAALAIILLTLIQKRGGKNIFRAARLMCYMLAAFFIAYAAWSAILPDIDAEGEHAHLQERSTEHFSRGILTPVETHYIKYIDDESGLIVSFYNGDDKLVDSYVVEGIEKWSDLLFTDTVKLFFRNITRHPVLYFRGVVDAYLALANYYYPFESSSLSVVKEPSLFRAAENNFVGYYIFWPNVRSNIHALSPELYAHAQPFDGYRSPNIYINNFFTYMQTLTNFTFTLGLLLLPLCVIAAIVFAAKYKDNRAFAFSLIASFTAFGYLLLNSVGQAHIDRYAFPVYIPTWLAILSLAYGIVLLVKQHLQSTP